MIAMTAKIKENIIITTPIGTTLNIEKDMVTKNPLYSDKYDDLFEEVIDINNNVNDNEKEQKNAGSRLGAKFGFARRISSC